MADESGSDPQGPDVSKPPTGPSGLQRLSGAAIPFSALLLAGSIAIYYAPPIGSSFPPDLPVLLFCVGLAIALFAFGDEAKIVHAGVTLTGAAAIGLVLFLVLQDSSRKREMKVGLLTVERQTTGGTGSSAVRAVRIYQQTGVWRGSALNKGDGAITFVFNLTGSEYAQIFETDCPRIEIEFESGAKVTQFRYDNNINIARGGYVFDLSYRPDSNRAYYRAKKSHQILESCDDNLLNNSKIKNEIATVETNTESKPAAGSAPENRPLSEAASVAPVSSKGLVGYVVFGEISQKSNRNPKSWFEIEGRPDASAPAPNDILRVLRPIRLRPVPYHWDPGQRRHVEGASEITTLQIDTRLVAGGDVMVAYDENKKVSYVIVSVASVIGQTYPAVEPFKSTVESGPSAGFTYAGSVDDTGTLSEQIFDNVSRPDALYPAPRDILVARSNVWLRSGPRRWDRAAQRYVSEPTIRPIKQGQYVRVSGDTSLAKGGLSIWVPIDRVEDGIKEARAE